MVPSEKGELLVSVSFWYAGLVYPGIARHGERRRDLEGPRGIFHSCDFLRFQLTDFAGIVSIWISLSSHLLCRIQMSPVCSN